MNKTRSWFYQMLFSYLPAFFLLSCVLFLISFLAISENIKKTTVKSTQVFSEQVSQVIENFLQPIERMATKEILVDPDFKAYFRDHKFGTYENYEIVQKLRSLSLDFPDIDSVYVYRQADGMVLSDNMFARLSDFADRDFILTQLNAGTASSWAEKRSYYDQKARKTSEVVSLVRKVPFLTGEQGIVVVNIRVGTIRSLVSNMSSHNINFVNVYDKTGRLLFSTSDSGEDAGGGKEIAVAASGMTGWSVGSGIKDAERFRFFSGFAYFWVVTCLLSIAVGVLWIVYVTRKNYKPIQSILNQVNAFFVNKNVDIFGKGRPDEMRFISMAIDNLLEQSNTFQNQYAEDLIHIRRHFFAELIRGHRAVSPEEWGGAMKRLGKELSFGRVSFGILEIDRYCDFSERYSDRDQYLLKFVIQSMVGEMAQSDSLTVWCEWIGSSRLGMIYFLNDGNAEPHGGAAPGAIPSMCGKAIAWINDNLHLTATIGLAGTAASVAGLPGLLEEAEERLQYKAVLGNRRVIGGSDLAASPMKDLLAHLQLVHQIAKAYRLGEEWEAPCLRLFDEVRAAVLSNEDIRSLMNDFLYCLDREMNAASPEAAALWREQAFPGLTAALKKAELLEEFKTGLLQALKTAETELRSLRESKDNYRIIRQVKKYIEAHYADPDLSLARLSDIFHMNPRYLSQLFKKEYGEKFIDYLVRIRVQRAQELLQETMEPVQDIAAKVGYLHPFSFIRVFKKVVGVTPGDYRK
ncbi:AraC family transcriptional regulator [Paenibacillus humicola]|uniref:AraC family transcriptional regulator n=1 Tax=Paenibacillus humicola TaxID=3110540 RepID=UPI00237BCE40|nr:AraC family transcriptional regulator [Paenibacillus humicola]